MFFEELVALAVAALIAYWWLSAEAAGAKEKESEESDCAPQGFIPHYSG